MTLSSRGLTRSRENLKTYFYYHNHYYLNVNSLQNFEKLNGLIEDTFDIFLVSENKLDPSFLDSQFSILGYRIVRKDRNQSGGGILFFINENIPFKVIESKQVPGNLEMLTLEIIFDQKNSVNGIISALIL